ncbi:MAG: hypothetical protein JWO84_91 [Parcubacteria group bacterium]|nr:hypothetical protein [Parcubacteria group bacterium]
MRFATFIPMLALALLLGTGAAHAQTGSTTTTTGTTVTTPGTPNTGAGGNAGENALILTGTGAVALLGATYLLRSRTR